MKNKKDNTTPIQEIIPIPVSLKPMQESKAADRRVWSIPLAGIWLPFFMASNVMGQSNISAEALGAPLRLAVEKDGTPRFSNTGRPVVRVVKEIADQVRIVRENFTYGLLAYAERVIKAHPDEYKAQVLVAQKAGAPLIQKDTDTLNAYIEKVKAEAERACPDVASAAPAANVPTDTAPVNAAGNAPPATPVMEQAEAAAATEANKELVPA